MWFSRVGISYTIASILYLMVTTLMDDTEQSRSIVFVVCIAAALVTTHSCQTFAKSQTT